METESKSRPIKVENGGVLGGLWFIGWLFTIGFAGLTWWQAIFGILVWPYYLGLAAR